MTVIDPAVTLQVSENDKVLEPYRQPRLPGYGEQQAPAGWREDQDGSRCQR